TLCRVVVTACVVILPIGAVDAQTPASPSAGTAALRPGLAARGESLAAFDERCIPSGGVAPPSNTPGILSRRALPAGRLARLGATPDVHHGLLGQQRAADGVVLNDEGLPQYSTFSLCAIDPATGQSGASVTTRVPFVGRAVPHVRAGVGAVCTQASTVVEYGPRGL